MPVKTYRKKRTPTAKLARPARGKIRVVIVDDHPLFRKGLRQAVQEDARFEVVGEADHSETALKLIQEQEADVAVLDVHIPGINGLELAAVLKARKCRTNLVILTVAKDEKVFNQALNLGIKGYVLKKNGAAEILNCIAAVAVGEAYVSPSLTDVLLRRRGRIDHLASRQPGLENLTVTERRILKRIAVGKTSREIAAECSVSPRTVESHRARICDKLGLSGSNRLLQFALEHRDALSQLD